MANAGDKDSIEENPSDAVEMEDGDPLKGGGAEEEDEEEDGEEEEMEQRPMSREARLREEKRKLEGLLRRLQTETVPLRVHDVVIKGNSKTKESLIESEVEALKNATTLQEVFQIASLVNARLREMELFDAVEVTLDAGPPELPGTTNVIVEVVEAQSPVTGSVGMYTKPGARTWSIEGALRFKNLFGYGDHWDGSLAYGFDQTSELSAGVTIPRLKGFYSPVNARVSLLSQDWLKYSSYKEQVLGLTLGLFSSRSHDLSYNLSCRTLTDPSQMASKTIRRQLGHTLVSSLKYTFKIDRRNSIWRPTKGHAFASTTQIGGLSPDSRSLRFIRQEFDLRYALPLGFCNAALNLGISTGVVFPWGHGSLSAPSPVIERFFLGGNVSPVCSLGGPAALLGFKSRGLGLWEPRRRISGKSDDGSSETAGEDAVGGDLAVTSFADLSFDLPLKVLRDAGIHGHAFACAGNLTKLTENEYKRFSFKNFMDSSRTSVGFGVVVPTKLFRMEANYCYILRKDEHDHGKSGVQFCFSAPQ
uniref:Bacterial surface antigen (D15) domain-containing protein n=1 Tax=Kalanchoe fedtschenkoi TaxID=63787 RepID=A0A7N0RIL9_KALFE